MKKSFINPLSFPAATEEPMLKNRFVVTFIANKEIEIPSYLICEINLPKFIKREWQEISISIRNMLNTKILKELKRMLNEEVVVMAIQIEILDPVGSVFGKWIIEGEVSGIDFGDLNSKSFENENSDLMCVTSKVF
jgi:hypothetical protein